jgi:hypothetical protein
MKKERIVEMAALETIEREIMQLSKKELSEFRKWFDEFDAALWDRQLESDAVAGKLDKLAEEAQTHDTFPLINTREIISRTIRVPWSNPRQLQ